MASPDGALGGEDEALSLYVVPHLDHTLPYSPTQILVSAPPTYSYQHVDISTHIYYYEDTCIVA
jgi:hypothetical protein